MKRVCIFFIFVLSFMPFLGAQENGDAPGVESVETPVVKADDASDAAATAVESQETPKAAANDAPAVPAVKKHAVEHAAVNIEEAASNWGFFIRLGIALAIIVAEAFLLWLLWKLFNSLSLKTTETGKAKFKPLVIKQIRLLSTRQIIEFVLVLLRILKYV